MEAGGPLPEFDLHVPVLTIPHFLGTALETIPAPIPYLRTPPGHRVPLPGGGDDVFKVGLVWAGNPNFVEDKARSPRLEPLLPLLELPGVRFYSLQKGDGRRDLEGRTMPASFVDLDDRIEDFVDTASLVDQLDLVITSCSSPAHLAGAMGRPVWVLLPFIPDYRWLMEREDTPWYPTMRLFRQRRRGDWPEVVARVAAALAGEAAQRRGGALGATRRPAARPAASAPATPP